MEAVSLSRYCESSEAEAPNARMVVGAGVEPSRNAKRTVLTSRQGAKVDGVITGVLNSLAGASLSKSYIGLSIDSCDKLVFYGSSER